MTGELFFNRLRKLSEGKEVESICEFRGIRKDGSTIRVELSSNLIEYNGQLAVQGVFLDVTKRKEAEEKLKESEEKYQTTFESSMDALMLLDEKGFFDCNKATLGLFGCRSVEEFTKFHPADLSPPTQPDGTPSMGAAMSRIQKAFQTGTDHFFWIHKRTDGTIFPADVLLTRMPLKDREVLQATVRDITELKKVEETLRKSEEEYSSLFSNMIDGFAYCQMVFDEAGKPVDFVYLQVNDAFERMTGLKRDLIIGKKASEVIPGIKDDNPELFEIYGRVALTGQKEKNEHLQKYLNVWLSVSVYSPAKGYFAAILEDITQRKKTQESLKESEEKSRNFAAQARYLAEESPNIIFINKQGRVVYANKKSEEITGYSREEFYSPNFNFLSLCAPEYVEEVKSFYSRHLRGEAVPPYDYVLISKYGKRINVITTTKLIEYGGDAAILGIMTDITERKKAEEELKIAASIFDLATDSIFVHDMDGNIVNFNEAAYKLRGYSKEEMSKMNIQDLDSPESAKLVKPRINELLRNGSAVFESVEVCKDKSLLPTELHVRLIELGGKKLILSVARDITERKEAEKKLKENNARIELMNEKLRVVGSLTRHDVRNKLSAVNGYTYLLKKKHACQADIVEGLSKIELAVSDSVKIFEFARMYEQLGVEELSYVDVGKAVDEAVALFSGLTLRVVNDCHGVRALADSFLRQMFYNFIDNTVKYGEKATTVRVYFEQEESGGLRLIYEDNGVGVSSENKQKLFTEGFSTGGSTGFGLFFIKKMMDVYGWTITEEGEPLKGAKFVIHLPPKN